MAAGLFSLFAVILGVQTTWEIKMADLHSRAYGLAHDEVLELLLTALLKNGTLTVLEVHDILEKSADILLSNKTDLSAAASEHIRRLAVAVGVAPDETR
jgi:hypothetical protein